MYLDESNVIAYLFGWMIEDEFHLNNIAVDSHYRKMGIGKKLIETMIDYVISKNGRRILLEGMQENLSAIRLYEKMGFTAVGDHKDYYTKGKHAICYNLDLSNG